MGFAISKMKLSSPAFVDGEAMPRRHTGEGDDVSPPFSWTQVPEGTKGFALICHDPDAPLVSPGSYGFVHWVLYNIPGSARNLAEGTREHTPGSNNFNRQDYGGPMPPEGHGTHRYYFWLLALDTDRAFEGGLTLWKLLEELEPHVIGMNRLVGTYSRT